MTKFQKIILTIGIVLVVAFFSFIFGWAMRQKYIPNNALPVIGKVPQYTLTNQLGQKVSSKKFLGKVRVVTFLFPYCKEYCPLIALNLVSLEHDLKTTKAARDVQFVAFNVDPSQTGPSQMKEFMKQYGWNPTDLSMQYLTGSPGKIKKIVTGSYFVYYQKVTDVSEQREEEKEKKNGTYVPSPEVSNPLADKVNPDYDVVHNDALAIVDTKGRIRKIYQDADRISNEQLLKIIYRLLPSESSKK